MSQSMQDLVSRLERGLSAFCEALVALGETDRLDEDPVDGAWSPREVTGHYINSERWSRGCVEQMLGQSAPELAPPEFDEGETGPVEEFAELRLIDLVRLLERERQQTLALLAHTGDRQLGRTGRLPQGVTTLGEWLDGMATHEAGHTAQLNALLAAAPPGH